MSANSRATKTVPTPRKAVPRKTGARPTAAPANDSPPRAITDPEIISRVTLSDNREVRITRIKTGLREDLIRVGINLLPMGENMSGAVFPESYVDEVIAALRKVQA